ncbi:T-cell leukemia homeobox protein 1-like [Diorhabda sublineata]|uniref:T-cell leukemia homeobox protein 1-like n=1 Tax=Diorhabda sublineata TaxID=1163346 RepID=UPI0024E09F51|nr:T-cell leukemia homeobox protein 1-like [Diorhabda sublineata]
MSFLIDDILNSKNAIQTQENHDIESVSSNLPPLEKNNEQHGAINLGFSEQNSILHQTLLNRLNSPYFRTSEPRVPSLDNYQHLCYDPSYLNYYRSFYEREYSTLQRQKPWPTSPYDNQPNYLSYAMQYKYMYSPSKRKGGQVRFTANQTDILEKRFCSNKYLSPEERKVLAESLSLSDRQVKTWFQNRRAKWRRSHSNGGQPQGAMSNSTDGDIIKTVKEN